jgi:ankyrin repeat protein
MTSARDFVGATPLHDAVPSGKINAVKKLLEHGADVNVRTSARSAQGESLFSIWAQS